MPLEDLSHFGCSEDDILALRHNDNIAQLICFEANRAHAFYLKAAALETMLQPQGRRGLAGDDGNLSGDPGRASPTRLQRFWSARDVLTMEASAACRPRVTGSTIVMVAQSTVAAAGFVSARTFFMNGRPRVGIIGGGLAGLAAASVLCEADVDVEILEANRHLGGRAGSFIDPTTGDLVDHCQHVAMGCCAAFLDFCQRTGIEQHFRRDENLYFFSPEGIRNDFRASRWLPAPLHLGPAMMRLGYLSWREKLSIALALLALGRWHEEEDSSSPTIGQWLRRRGQSQRVIDRFWSVVLVSALGESVDRASLSAAQKIFVDGFLSHRDAYHVLVPQAPLGEIYEAGVARWLREQGVRISLESRIERLETHNGRVQHVVLPDGNIEFDAYILAVPWQGLPKLLSADTIAKVCPQVESIEASPITSIHLWYDRAITSLPHAVLVERLTHWLFNHNVACVSRRSKTRNSSGMSGDLPHEATFYYQAVISASHELQITK